MQCIQTINNRSAHAD